MHKPDLLKVRMPAIITDPQLQRKFAEVKDLGFDMEVLWESVTGRLGMGVSDDLWLYHMDSIQESLEEESIDSDLLPDYREMCKHRLDNWNEFFSTCQQIYAHACYNYSMFQNHPILDACVYNFDVNEVTGGVTMYKEKDRVEDNELKKSLHPTMPYPYANHSGPSNWN